MDPVAGKYCGSVSPFEFNSSTNTLSLTMITDYGVVETGFVANIKTTPRESNHLGCIMWRLMCKYRTTEVILGVLQSSSIGVNLSYVVHTRMTVYRQHMLSPLEGVLHHCWSAPTMSSVLGYLHLSRGFQLFRFFTNNQSNNAKMQTDFWCKIQWLE